MFERVNHTWIQRQKLTATLGPPNFFRDLGRSLAISSDAATIVVGAPLSETAGTTYKGAVAIFERLGAVYSQTSMFTPQPGVSNFGFGRTVQCDASSTRIFVCPSDASNQSTSVREFIRSGPGWLGGAELVPSSGGPSSGFGWSIAVDEVASELVIGAPLADTPLGVDTGQIHPYSIPCAPTFIYCTAKTNSAGCAPPIAYSGTASASAGSGFTISASEIRNLTSGILFYSQAGRAALPYQGGTLCAFAPYRRSPLQFSSGSPPPAIDCTGTFSVDFNVLVLSNSTLIAGARVQAQFWSRDALAVPPSGFTNAVDFYLAP